MIFVTSGSEVFESKQTHKHMEKYSGPLISPMPKKYARKTGSGTSGLVGIWRFLEVGSLWKAEVDTSLTAARPGT